MHRYLSVEENTETWGLSLGGLIIWGDRTAGEGSTLKAVFRMEGRKWSSSVGKLKSTIFSW